MIVTSKRVFINVLAQYMSRQDLLKATYFIPDVNDPSSRAHFSHHVEYYDDGSFEVKSTPEFNTGISRFNIIYGDGWLDPTWAINQTTANSIGCGTSSNVGLDPVQVYVDQLQKPQTIIGVRDWLYGRLTNPQYSKGLRIMIINDEDIVKQFGHQMCYYLSKFFGENITFLDVKYRPQIVPGYVQYKGDKEFSKKMLHDLGDYDLLLKLTGLISQSGVDPCLCNLNAFLSVMSMDQLFYSYEKLFPNDPLPAGNYSKDQMITIITGKAAEKAGVVYNIDQRSSSLSTINDYLQSIDDALENSMM